MRHAELTFLPCQKYGHKNCTRGKRGKKGANSVTKMMHKDVHIGMVNFIISRPGRRVKNKYNHTCSPPLKMSNLSHMQMKIDTLKQKVFKNHTTTRLDNITASFPLPLLM